MRVHRGSIRDCLQRASYLQLPHGLYPHNRKWKFRRKQHERVIDQFIARLRVIADDLEFALHGELP